MSEILTKIIPSNPAHKSPFAVISHESIHDHVIAAGNPCRVLREITKKDKEYWNQQYFDYLNDKDIRK